jgi:hypothetical protein
MERISLESFDTKLHGHTILCNGTFRENNKIKMPPIIEYVSKLKEPFKKKILLSNTPLGLSKHIHINYDAVFSIHDASDWTMIATYITYVPKPLLIICEESVPDALWNKLTRGITFIHITNKPIINLRAYDCIFFSITDDISANYIEYTHRILQNVYKTVYTLREHKDIIQELKVAKSGLVWTRIDEETPTGNIFWFDPIENIQGDGFSPNQLSELFQCLAHHFQGGAFL